LDTIAAACYSKIFKLNQKTALPLAQNVLQPLNALFALLDISYNQEPNPPIVFQNATTFISKIQTQEPAKVK
jgi:hypothetical protein